MSHIDIAIAHGDGIGPEIMDATLRILQAADCKLTTHTIEIGEKVYHRGFLTGIEPQSWEILKNTRAFLKAPVTTPQGGGFKSLNVTIRAFLGLFANVRPCIAYSPFVATKHPNMDVVIVRENEEDLYVGIEYRQTQESYHAIKMISKSACERIVRYAFEYARSHRRSKVSCFTKDNILKMSDGLFHSVYESIGQEYPEIEKEHWIIDIGTAKLADTPHLFDVIVLPNLYGDILSDVAAQISGSVGLAGSANIGARGAMFEAIHGSAPRRANQNKANPSGLLLAAIMMLEHLGMDKQSELIHNAWLATIQQGIHTYDIFQEEKSSVCVGTREFADAVIQRLGSQPTSTGRKKERSTPITIKPQQTSKKQISHKQLVGVDIYIESTHATSSIKHHVEHALEGLPIHLTLIANRGSTTYAKNASMLIDPINPSDEWRLRFLASSDEELNAMYLVHLQENLIKHNLIPIRTEHLFRFDKTLGFSLSPEEQ